MRLIKTFATVGLLLALGSPAIGQSGCGGQFGAGKFCGNATGSTGLPGPVLLPAGGTTPIAGGTVLGNPTSATALPVATSAPVLGIPGVSLGQISFANTTSGAITVQPAAGALGVSLLTLPAVIDTLAGVKLANGGTNASLTASNGGVVWSNATQLQILAGTATANQMLQSGASATPSWSTATWPSSTTINQILYSSAANTVTGIVTVNGGILNTSSSGVPTITTNPLLGVIGSAIGQISFAGSSSGSVKVTAQAAAGTSTVLSLPNTTGTLADGASSPLVLNATTGNLTCPTCVTSSGGTISGTPPIAVSGAGVISITGAAGQILAGSSPAFTATPVLGVAGTTVGTLGFQNLTSGTETIQPATGALVSGIATLQAGTYNLIGTNTTDTLTNKTITSSTDVLGGVTMTLGSDATGDIYYRSAGGVLTRLPIGGTSTILTVAGGLPSWAAAPGGGNVSNSGTPTANQLAQWVTATTIQGVNASSVISGSSSVTVGGTTSLTLSANNSMGANKYQVINSTGTTSLTVPTGAAWMKMRLVGGGGGGSGGGVSGAASGGAGNPTCLNTTGAACTTPLIQASGGGGGIFSSGAGGAGGSVSGSGTCTDPLPGGVGSPETQALAGLIGNGGPGGNSQRGGAGNGSFGNVAGGTAATNSGSGGQGGGAAAGGNAGAGGGSGAYCEYFIQTPAASYTIQVGSGGSGGTAGVSGSAGGAGATGHIDVEFGFN